MRPSTTQIYGSKPTIYNISCWVVYIKHRTYDLSHMRLYATNRLMSLNIGRFAGLYNICYPALTFLIFVSLFLFLVKARLRMQQNGRCNTIFEGQIFFQKSKFFRNLTMPTQFQSLIPRMPKISLLTAFHDY